MQVVSSTEFMAHQDKYFDMAINHELCVRRGQNMFRITYEPPFKEQAVLQPDEDLRRAITGDELLAGIYDDLETFFASKQ